MAKKKTPAATSQEIAYKGFDKDLSCRGFQYEIGKTYVGTTPVVRCGGGGFHSCAMPLDVWNYYPPATSRLAEVIPCGEIDRATDSDTKIASAEITVRAELRLPDFIKRAAEWVIAAAKANTATGYRGHAAATGKNSVASSTGINGTASAGEGGAIVLAAYDGAYNLVAVFASKVDENGIKAGVTYRLGTDGKPVAVSP